MGRHPPDDPQEVPEQVGGPEPQKDASDAVSEGVEQRGGRVAQPTQALAVGGASDVRDGGEEEDGRVEI